MNKIVFNILCISFILSEFFIAHAQGNNLPVTFLSDDMIRIVHESNKIQLLFQELINTTKIIYSSEDALSRVRDNIFDTEKQLESNFLNPEEAQKRISQFSKTMQQEQDTLEALGEAQKAILKQLIHTMADTEMRINEYMKIAHWENQALLKEKRALIKKLRSVSKTKNHQELVDRLSEINRTLITMNRDRQQAQQELKTFKALRNSKKSFLRYFLQNQKIYWANEARAARGGFIANPFFISAPEKPKQIPGIRQPARAPKSIIVNVDSAELITAAGKSNMAGRIEKALTEAGRFLTAERTVPPVVVRIGGIAMRVIKVVSGAGVVGYELTAFDTTGKIQKKSYIDTLSPLGIVDGIADIVFLGTSKPPWVEEYKKFRQIPGPLSAITEIVAAQKRHARGDYGPELTKIHEEITYLEDCLQDQGTPHVCIVHHDIPSRIITSVVGLIGNPNTFTLSPEREVWYLNNEEHVKQIKRKIEILREQKEKLVEKNK